MGRSLSSLKVETQGSITSAGRGLLGGTLGSEKKGGMAAKLAAKMLGLGEKQA
jgi:hypothetical protein